MGKITGYSSLTTPASNDLLVIVDVDDLSMAPTGTDKKITAGTLLGMGGTAVYYMPAPSGGDDTAAFQAALAALPTTTIFANPNNSTGASATVHTGTIILASGTYKLGASADWGNIGPLVSVIGPGRNACTLAYFGAVDCVRLFNPVRPTDDTFDCLAAFHGILNGFTIDGANALAGAMGLHYGDTEGGVLGPDLMIQNFSQGTLSGPPVLSLGTTNTSGGTFAAGSEFWVVTAITRNGETQASNSVTATLVLNGTQQLNWTTVAGATGYRIYRQAGFNGPPYNTYVAQVGTVTTYTDTGSVAAASSSVPPQVNYSGNTGLCFDNTVSWTESIYGRVLIRNCANAVTFIGANGVPDTSFEYNDLTFKIYGMQNQNGIVLAGGAFYNNGSLKARANFANGPTAMTTAFLALVGAYQGIYTTLGLSHLELQAEINSPVSGGGTHGPMTISFSDWNHNQINGCEGVLSFLQVGQPWTLSNYANSTEKTNFKFSGIVAGDTNLAPANAANPVGMGAQQLATGFAQTGGFMPLASGDAFSLTLTANTTLQLAAGGIAIGIGGPQRKTILITQAASGGPWTVTWPKPGSPTLSSPAVYWPGGTAPTMSAGASAIDKYVLETVDGVHWYGSAFQALS